MHLASTYHVGVYDPTSVIVQGLHNDGIVPLVVYVLMCSLQTANYGHISPTDSPRAIWEAHSLKASNVQDHCLCLPHLGIPQSSLPHKPLQPPPFQFTCLHLAG